MWDAKIIQLVLEFLAHFTPTSCVVPNILSAAMLLLPITTTVKELPSFKLVPSCCTVLLHVSKLIAAYDIAWAEWFEQLLIDGTSRRQTPIQNVITKILNVGGYKTVSVSTAVLLLRINQQSH